MTFEEIRGYCLALNGTTEDFPFGEETLVFRVGGKIYALTGVYGIPLTINLKCDPEKAVDLRERYDAISPGYHMNKKHWNTVTIDGSLNNELVKELIHHSYDLVYESLKKSVKQELEKL